MSEATSEGTMTRIAHLAAALTLCAAPVLGSRLALAEPPVQVHVDVHLPVPVVPVPVPVPVPMVPPPVAPHRHHREPPHRERARPTPEEWSEPEPPRRREGGEAYSVPPDRVPGRGLCRVWYDELPPDRQPPPMSCERAHHVAQRRGGRVIWAQSGQAYQDGRVASRWYGRVDFSGVPPDRLPPPGSCRTWLDGVPPDRQPPPGPCEHVEREARRLGGRVLYMPAP